MDVEVTRLPGIGVRKDFRIAGRRRIGVVDLRDGRVDLIASRVDDTDSCEVSIELTALEAATLGNLLGAVLAVEDLQRTQDELPDITTRSISMPAGSVFRDRPLGDTAMRSRIGVSIVAIMRHGKTLPSPSPAEILREGDIIFVVGTPEALERAAALLQQS